MSVMFLGLMMWGVVALVLLGCLAPLVVGVVRRRLGKGGKVLVGVGAVWCLLALGLVGLTVKAYMDWNRTYNHEVAAFDASTYAGAVGTLSFPYAYSAENKVAWYAAGGGRKPPAFEAVDSSGKCFWRDNFEYG